MNRLQGKSGEIDIQFIAAIAELTAKFASDKKLNVGHVRQQRSHCNTFPNNVLRKTCDEIIDRPLSEMSPPVRMTKKKASDLAEFSAACRDSPTT